MTYVWLIARCCVISYILLTCTVWFAGAARATPWPASDPTNSMNWTPQINYWDEFEGSSLDAGKWVTSNPTWSGQFPSQFAASNVNVSGGSLRLATTNYNVVVNGCFEKTLSPWTTTGNVAWDSNRSDMYLYCGFAQASGCVVETGQSSCWQVVTLLPNTTYYLTGLGRCGPGGTGVAMGIKNYGGSELVNHVASGSWAYISPIVFTTGSGGPVHATVYVSNYGGSGTVYGGEVAIVPQSASLTPSNYIGAGLVQSKNQAPCGYYECRMRLSPGTDVDCFFMTTFPNANSEAEEIDVQEGTANSIELPQMNTSMQTNCHWFSNGQDYARYLPYDPGVSLSDRFHVYGLDWEPNTISYYFDGKLVNCIPNLHNTRPENIILNTESFGERGTPASGSSTVFMVDYLRSWTRTNSATQVALQSAASGYYITCNLNYSDLLLAQWATQPTLWEQFKIVDLGQTNGIQNVALQSMASGYYVTCNLNSNSILLAQWATAPTWWETYEWIDIGNGAFALYSPASGHYVTCSLNQSAILYASQANTVGLEETFYMK